MQKGRTNTKKLVLSALFVTLALLMSRFLKLKLAPGFSLSFGGYPLMFGGMVLGPYYGFMMGIVTDVLNYALAPSSFGFNAFFTISEGLIGWFPGFILWKLSKGEGFAAMQNDRKLQNKVIISTSLFRAIFLNIFLNTALLYPYMGNGVLALLPARATKNAIEIFTVYFALTAMVEALRARKVSFEM